MTVSRDGQVPVGHVVRMHASGSAGSVNHFQLSLTLGELLPFKGQHGMELSPQGLTAVGLVALACRVPPPLSLMPILGNISFSGAQVFCYQMTKRASFQTSRQEACGP